MKNIIIHKFNGILFDQPNNELPAGAIKRPSSCATLDRCDLLQKKNNDLPTGAQKAMF
jgi:hypothetical protein